MKDIIWTLIIVWLIYKLAELFRTSFSGRQANERVRPDSHGNSAAHSTHNQSRSDKDLEKALKNHLNHEGEYVDFEEVK
jgi:hypothetical protein